MSTAELLHILRALDLHSNVMDLALLPPAFILTWVRRPVSLEPVTIHFGTWSGRSGLKCIP